MHDWRFPPFVQQPKSTLAFKSWVALHRKWHLKRRVIDHWKLKPSAGPLSMKTQWMVKVLQVNLSLYPLSFMCSLCVFSSCTQKGQLVSHVVDSLNRDKWLVNTGLSLFETKHMSSAGRCLQTEEENVGREFSASCCSPLEMTPF